MRILSFVLMFGILVAGCGTPREQTDMEMPEQDQLTEKTPPSRDFKTYLYESGRVGYELEGTPAGKETLYWDNWGMNTARYMVTSTSYVPDTKDTTIVIMDRDNTYTIDTGKKSGIVSPMRPKEVLDFSVGDVEVVEKEMSKRGIAGGYEVLPDEEILGVHCQVARIEVMGNINTQWVHKGIMLKMETVSKKSGKLFSSQTAVDFSPDVPVDPEVFEIPDDIEMKTLAEVQAEARDAMKKTYEPENDDE